MDDPSAPGDRRRTDSRRVRSPSGRLAGAAGVVASSGPDCVHRHQLPDSPERSRHAEPVAISAINFVTHNGVVTRLLRYAWAGPTTLIGLALAIPSLRRGHVAVVDGVIEAHSPFLRRALASFTPLALGADAMTLGHVVIGRDAHALEATRAHERVHVRQYEWWGPLFVPAYLLAGAWALLRGGHPYFDNRFERDARLGEIPTHHQRRSGCPPRTRR
jgi:hypothetical protein